jgi:anti-sigma B factor antagonist
MSIVGKLRPAGPSGGVVEINVRRRGDVQLIELRGALRLGDGVEALRAAVEEAFAAGDVKIVVNLAEVPMIDSSAIGVLVKCMASAKQRGGAVKLVNPSKFAAQTLRLVGVLILFQVFDNEAAAVASFS